MYQVEPLNSYTEIGAPELRHVPLLERLERERNLAYQKLVDIDLAIGMLKNNPGFQELLDTLDKVTNRL